jgi:hypothetical protein
MAIFGWAKLNEGFAESEMTKRGFDLRRPTGLHSDLGCFQAVSVPVSTLSGLSHRFHWGPRQKRASPTCSQAANYLTYNNAGASFSHSSIISPSPLLR